MGCSCTTYKTNLSNRQQATEQTWQKLTTTRDLNFEQPVWSWSSAIWPGNGVWHIIISWVIFVQNMKGISQIGAEPWGRHDKTLNNLCDRWPFNLMFCVSFMKIQWEEHVRKSCDAQMDTDKAFFIELAACCNWKYLDWKWPIRIVFQFYPYTYFWWSI